MASGPVLQSAPVTWPPATKSLTDRKGPEMRGESQQRNDEQWNMRLLGHCDLGGMGDGMHVALKGAYAFCGHMADGGTSIVDIRDSEDPRLVGRIPAP